MSEAIRTNDVTEEMKQFNMAADTLGGFFQMMQPKRTGKILMERCRFYSRLFELCMKHLEMEEQILSLETSSVAVAFNQRGKQ